MPVQPDSLVFLTVRGTFVPPTVDGMRKLHDDTAGSPQGIAAARSFGDLSHKVYLPMGTAKPTESLFLDVWTSAQGIQSFFANEMVINQGSKLFKSRDSALWMPALGAFSFHLPAPASKRARLVGLLRAPVSSPEKAIEVFRDTISAALPDARKRGQLSHQIFIRLSPPGESAQAELLGLDEWADPEGMMEHYQDQKHMGPLAKAFAGAPQSSVWEQADPAWSEW
jgi:hypothetical protein